MPAYLLSRPSYSRLETTNAPVGTTKAYNRGVNYLESQKLPAFIRISSIHKVNHLLPCLRACLPTASYHFISTAAPSGFTTLNILVAKFLPISCSQLGKLLSRVCGVTLGGRINCPLLPLKICATIASETVSTSIIGGRNLLLASSSG